MASSSVSKVSVENVNHPGQTNLVDAHTYNAMRKAMLKAAPPSEPGLTLVELSARVTPTLS